MVYYMKNGLEKCATKSMLKVIDKRKPLLTPSIAGKWHVDYASVFTQCADAPWKLCLLASCRVILSKVWFVHGEPDPKLVVLSKVHGY